MKTIMEKESSTQIGRIRDGQGGERRQEAFLSFTSQTQMPKTIKTVRKFFLVI